MSGMGITKTCTADFNQWLHAMRMVVRLPGEVPPEFRKKLWLALAERYLHIKRIDWEREAPRCLSDMWKSDDEELADQIVKDLHRTGSSFCTSSVNQAKLKRVLVGYARFNQEVGYCQGFNMLGALILQVVDKDEAAAIKIMIYLIEGVLPPGYFSGALTGLQADMAVFRELLSTKLPRLSKHLHKLTNEGLEPPLINVFTMQWFLTLFCTCLPLSCVLRIWDLILTDGGDVLLRTALALWELLEGRILSTRSADEFYCKMGLLSGDMLSGSLIEPNDLVQRIVAMGPIQGLHKLRDKHLHSIAQWKDKGKLRLFYSDDEADSDDDSKVALATVWGLRLTRRGSTGVSKNPNATPDRERIALDINLLKQQYGKLRQRQKQAQIILTAACARQTNPLGATSSTAAAATSSSSPSPKTLNNLLVGRSAITSNKGRRMGAPQGAIPPARNTSGKAKSSIKTAKLPAETLHWKDTDTGTKKRRNSLKWKDVPRLDKLANQQVGGIECTDGPGPVVAEPVVAETSRGSSSRHRKRSESSSYSEESDGNSSTSTSLCDDENMNVVKDSGSSIESSPFKKKDSPELEFEVPVDKIMDIQNYIDSLETESNYEIVSMDSATGAAVVANGVREESAGVGGVAGNRLEIQIEEEELPITSTSQLSPVADLSQYLNVSTISPLKTPSAHFDLSDMLTTLSPSSPEFSRATSCDGLINDLEITDEGITNTYFERINSAERPTNLDLTDSGGTTTTRTTFERNSTLSIPTYEIIDVDEMDQDVKIERSSSLNVLRNADLPTSSQVSPQPPPEQNGEMNGVKKKCFKGKSSSLEDTKRPVLRKSLPVSCSDTMEIKKSEKALEIIQENSKILHRILKKNSSPANHDTIDSEDSPLNIPSFIIKAHEPEASMVVAVPRKEPESITDTLSSIENTIKSINSLCQERESFEIRSKRTRLMESIEEIFNSSTAISPRVQINSAGDDIMRKLNPSRSPSLSPIRELGRDSSTAELLRGSSGDHLSDSYRPWSRSTSSSEYKQLPTPDPLKKFDKSPSSPIITRSYLESLKPSPSVRVTKSAENSPSRSLSRDLGEYGVPPTSPTKEDYLEGITVTTGDRDFLLRSVPGSSNGYPHDFGIEAKKHRSLEFDTI